MIWGVQQGSGAAGDPQIPAASRGMIRLPVVSVGHPLVDWERVRGNPIWDLSYRTHQLQMQHFDWVWRIIVSTRRQLDEELCGEFWNEN